MGRKIAVANQKGGVGKTTTAVNLSSSLAKLGKQVLLVDIDAQGNSCSGLGVEIHEDQNSVYELLMDECTAEEAIVPTPVSGLSIIPVNTHLSGAPIELAGADKREYRLLDALKPVINRFDYIIIDCPPALDLLTLNGLTAADSVLIPIQCEYYALEGMVKLMQTISLVQNNLNRKLTVEGVLLTMYDSRTNLSNQVVQEVSSYFQEKVFQTIIPRTVKIAEAPSHGIPIDEYDQSGTGAKSYMKLAEEVINHG